MMEAKSVEQGSSEDVIELQLKKAREEIAALQDDKDQLSQVKKIHETYIHIILCACLHTYLLIQRRKYSQ